MSMQREPGRALKALPNALFSFGRPVLRVGRRIFRYFFLLFFVLLFDLLPQVLCINDDSKIAKSESAIEVVLQNYA